MHVTLMDLLQVYKELFQAFIDEAHLWQVAGAKGLAALHLERVVV